MASAPCAARGGIRDTCSGMPGESASVTGRPIATVDAPIRAGDPAVLVAKVDRAERILGWRAKRTELSRIISDAWTWKQRAEQG